ncbi:cupin-like domain-containing protein [Marivibrio halodurans]|uniref:Cupin-like domain-containing protein n=1 Tax=Marivibrio halodurans TaxID=2039722 RepID=A0A8J7S7A8_9PROT|nr:cupin domain-containing protein [Marivibrio halodurans]MBP5858144.1 cupin-like domain-containing protein [Marivibrio halodurans]
MAGKKSDATTAARAMTGAPASFEEVLAPITPETFFTEYYDKQPLHIPGDPGKFGRIMNWSVLNGLLDMTAIWGSASLMLVLDGEVLPPGAYCVEAQNRDGQTVRQPDAGKVMALLRQGASLVANDIDTLTPELRAVADAMEDGFCGKAQSNLYCSWRQRQAFKSHFDTHDVFALHMEGEKLWRLYEGRETHPIRHRNWAGLSDAETEERKGKVMRDVRMTPGDLLYIPRGWYHDALAASGGTIHLAFGLTGVIGLDLIGALSDSVVTDETFRLNFPHPREGRKALADHIARLGDRLAEVARDPRFVEAFETFQKDYRYPRGGFDLPIEIADRTFALTARDFRVVTKDGRHGLASPRGIVPIPPGLDGPVRWVVEAGRFARGDLLDAFPAMSAMEIDRLLQQMQQMGVLREDASGS